jgi:ribosomal protein S18 acetylase RimI-like enzyme
MSDPNHPGPVNAADAQPIPGVRIRPLDDPADPIIVDGAALMASTPLWQRYGVTPTSAEARFRDSLQKNVRIFIAEKVTAPPPERVAGFAWAVARGMFNRSGYIPILGIAEFAFGTGLGGSLLRVAELYLTETAPDVFLLCSDFNTQARRFYERHGYHNVGALPGYLLPDVAEILYWKRVAV